LSSAEISAFVSARSLAFCAFGATEKFYGSHAFPDGLITANYIPDLKAKILKRAAHSPVDISRKIISAVRATLGQGAFLPYQSSSLRPIPELGQYRTPVPNVYLCSSGRHPGPGVSMAPGRNAAQVIFADLGLDFTSVVSGHC
jgi:beta-carotene ketolase (CrtO type)